VEKHVKKMQQAARKPFLMLRAVYLLSRACLHMRNGEVAKAVRDAASAMVLAPELFPQN
jgi:hypothetical protein